MGINRRKNSGSRKYYISEAYGATDFEYGEICKLGADSTNGFLKLDGESYAGPLEIRKDDFIGVSRVAAAAGAGCVLTINADAITNLVVGSEINFTIKNIILDDRAGGQLIKKTFKLIMTAADIVSDQTLNDRILAEMQNFFGSVAPHYVVAEASTTSVTVTDNIGGSLAHSKVNGYLEGEVDLGFETNDATQISGSVAGGTKPEGVRGVINRYVDEADFSTGDSYTTVTIEYWDRDADGRARGDVMVRNQAVIYFNETDITSRTGTSTAHLNSLVDHLVAFAGLGEGDAINLTSEAGTGAVEAETRVPLGALSIVCTPDANNEDIFITAGAPVGSKLIIQNAGGAHTVQVRSVGAAETIDGNANLDIPAGKIRVLYKFDATLWIESAEMS